MDYYQQDFMIKLGETAAGDVIEVPDLIIYMIPVVIIVILFTINEKNKSNH